MREGKGRGKGVGIVARSPLSYLGTTFSLLSLSAFLLVLLSFSLHQRLVRFLEARIVRDTMAGGWKVPVDSDTVQLR